MIHDPNDFRSSEWAARPSCRVISATATTLTTGVAGAITYDGTDRFDRWGMHDPSTNNTRITMPFDGVYAFGAVAVFAANATGQRTLRIRINGSTTLQQIQVETTSSGTITLPIHAIYQFASGDYIEALGLQNSGGDLDIPAVNSEFWAIFMVKT